MTVSPICCSPGTGARGAGRIFHPITAKPSRIRDLAAVAAVHRSRARPSLTGDLTAWHHRFASPNSREQVVPTIAYFYGIAIRMFFRDHPPPHFLASYSGHEANVLIDTGEVIEGGSSSGECRSPREGVGAGAS